MAHLRTRPAKMHSGPVKTTHTPRFRPPSDYVPPNLNHAQHVNVVSADRRRGPSAVRRPGQRVELGRRCGVFPAALLRDAKEVVRRRRAAVDGPAKTQRRNGSKRRYFQRNSESVAVARCGRTCLPNAASPQRLKATPLSPQYSAKRRRAAVCTGQLWWSGNEQPKFGCTRKSRWA